MNETGKITTPKTLAGVPASFINIPYGDHERNTLDLWMAKSETPTPLIIFVHGGGFVGGDKSRYYDSKDWDILLDLGISIACINYRFLFDAPYGILASMNDVKRCVQFLRYNAGKFNIDKTRIACSGGSAGAGSSLWLAFSEDMAIPGSEDPVLRESTKLSCVGAFSVQSTYDIFRWNKILGVQITDSEEQINNIAHAFGMPQANEEQLRQQHEIRNKLDFLSKIKNDSPPFFVVNKHEGGPPSNEDEINHHPLHAKALRDKAKEAGIQAIVYAPAIQIQDPSGMNFIEFMKLHLLK